ncbi:MAG TPA: ABC transporter permease subunit [Candidatus Thermoplasmatota archaeon]|nr:ABC transporter permease subunit [Candidatus Thermoplasmatota archaeon]
MPPRARVPLGSLLLLGAPLAFLALFFAFPLLITFREAASGSAWEWAFTHPYVRSRLVIALEQAFLSLAFALALTVPLALLHHRRRIPFARWHLALHAAPFVLPVFVVVYGLEATLGRGGWTEAAFGVDVLAVVGPLGAVALANAYYNYGLLARLLHAALERRPHRLEAAARTLGASRFEAFRRVSLPLLAPAIAAACLLAFLFSFTSFGVVLFLGAGEVSTLETLLYENMGGAFPRLDRAAVLGLVQLGLNLLLLAGYGLLRRREARIPRDPVPVAAPARPRHVAAAWASLAVPLLPALAVLVGAVHVGGAWTLEPVRAVLDPAHPSHVGGFDVLHAVGLSLIYAGAAVLLSLLLAALLAYGLRSLGEWPRRLVEGAAALPLGTSSLLVGFGATLAFGAGALLDLRGSLALVVAAHTLLAFPFTARAVLPALAAHDRRLDEAAAVLGAPPSHVVFRVHWPLFRAPLVVAAGMAAAISLGDFGASLVLMQSDTMSLSLWIGHHGGFDPLRRAQASALAALLMLITLAAYLVAEAFRKEDPLA